MPKLWHRFRDNSEIVENQMSEISLEEASMHGRLRQFRQKAENASSILAQTSRELQERGGYVSLSGGKDSTVVLHMALQHFPGTPVCFFKSDLEFPENLAYLDALAQEWNFDLQIIPTRSLLDITVSEGWFNHYRDDRDTGEDLQNVKIAEPSIKARRLFGDVFFWGLRADESRGRGALLRPNKGVTVYSDGRIGVSPVWNWSAMDIAAYCVANNIPQNPLYSRMEEVGVPVVDRRVGAIFDGGNIDNGRIAWLKRGWPEEYDKLRLSLPRLEEFS